jgi:hypothetical protein
MVKARRRIRHNEERDGMMMKVLWVVLAVVLSSLVISGCTETTNSQAYSAFSQRKEISINLCVSAVANRTGSSDVSVYQTQSFENNFGVWLYGPGRSVYQCTVAKNGPASYYIQTVRKLN